MVQIHGGGYTVGNAQSYPGDALVHASDGELIYVSIQYRLGLFGFLAGKDVAENGVQNAGLWDQRLALEWIHRHIAAFGGDPDKITIWGGSAGGGSVTYQLMYEGGDEEAAPAPFRAGIAEYPWWQPLLNGSTQELQYGLALEASGCADVECLRGLSEDELTIVGQKNFNESYPGTGNGYGSFWFGPVVDGTFLKELPSEAFKKGHYYKVPLVVDREGYEGLIFSNASQTNQVEETLDVSAEDEKTLCFFCVTDRFCDRLKIFSPSLVLGSSPGCTSCILQKTTTQPCSKDRAGSATSSSIVSNE